MSPHLMRHVRLFEGFDLLRTQLQVELAKCLRGCSKTETFRDY